MLLCSSNATSIKYNHTFFTRYSSKEIKTHFFKACTKLKINTSYAQYNAYFFPFQDNPRPYNGGLWVTWELYTATSEAMTTSSAAVSLSAYHPTYGPWRYWCRPLELCLPLSYQWVMITQRQEGQDSWIKFWGFWVRRIPRRVQSFVVNLWRNCFYAVIILYLKFLNGENHENYYLYF